MAIHESYEVADNEFTSLAFQSFWLVKEYDYADVPVGLTITYALEAGVILLGAAHVVVDAFSGSGVTLDVGDGSDDDAYIDNTNLDLQTDANFYYGGGGANAGAQGAYSESAHKVVMTFNEQPTAGSGKLLLHCLDLSTSWRVP